MPGAPGWAPVQSKWPGAASRGPSGTQEGRAAALWLVSTGDPKPSLAFIGQGVMATAHPSPASVSLSVRGAQPLESDLGSTWLCNPEQATWPL